MERQPRTQRPLPLRLGEEVQAVLPRQGRGEGPRRAREGRGGGAGARRRRRAPRRLPRPARSTRRASPGRRRPPTRTASARRASRARSERQLGLMAARRSRRRARRVVLAASRPRPVPGRQLPRPVGAALPVTRRGEAPRRRGSRDGAPCAWSASTSPTGSRSTGRSRCCGRASALRDPDVLALQEMDAPGRRAHRAGAGPRTPSTSRAACTRSTGATSAARCSRRGRSRSRARSCCRTAAAGLGPAPLGGRRRRRARRPARARLLASTCPRRSAISGGSRARTSCACSPRDAVAVAGCRSWSRATSTRTTSASEFGAAGFTWLTRDIGDTTARCSDRSSAALRPRVRARARGGPDGAPGAASSRQPRRERPPADLGARPAPRDGRAVARDRPTRRAIAACAPPAYVHALAMLRSHRALLARPRAVAARARGGPRHPAARAPAARTSQRAEWLNLNGDWSFRFDSEDAGERERWFEAPPAGFPLTHPRAVLVGLEALGRRRTRPTSPGTRARSACPRTWAGKRVFLVVGRVRLEDQRAGSTASRSAATRAATRRSSSS